MPKGTEIIIFVYFLSPLTAYDAVLWGDGGETFGWSPALICRAQPEAYCKSFKPV